MRRAVGIGLLALLAVAARSPADDDARSPAADLDELMHLLAARRHGQADFVEQHFLSLLKRPVESSGELFYDAPDRLEKRTAEPRRESLLLSGDVLTVQRGTRTHVLDLKAYPAVLPFIESIRATLAGDRSALERLFAVDYAGDINLWTLTLVPRDGSAARAVSRVRIEGSADTLRRVEIFEADGDRSLMTLRDHRAP